MLLPDRQPGENRKAHRARLKLERARGELSHCSECQTVEHCHKAASCSILQGTITARARSVAIQYKKA